MVCRNLFYTLDAARMESWLSDSELDRLPISSKIGRDGDSNESGLASSIRDSGKAGATRDARDTSDIWDFLTDSQRENALRAWAIGTVWHPASFSGGDAAAWIPPRQTVMLHAQVSSETQRCLLDRGQVVRRGTVAPRQIREVERAFMDILRPLLGVWYGRLMLLRVADRDQPWLVAQVDPQPWLTWLGWQGRSERSEVTGREAAGVGLLTGPPPGRVLWRGGDVVEMFGAASNDKCCCSLVESGGDPEVEALEAEFLDALGLVLTSSTEGTVVLDIDADYAEPV